jgi:hypothetical protein
MGDLVLVINIAAASILDLCTVRSLKPWVQGVRSTTLN